MDRDQEILLERLVGWAHGAAQPPFRMELNPTERCNLACVFCKGKLQSREGRTEVPDERLLEIVAQARALGVRQWRIVGGGEPMARPVTLKVMEAIKAGAMTGFMITNGTMFSEEAVRRLVAAGWDNITMSVDGPDPEVHDGLRGRSGAFASCVRVLESFRRAKKEAHALKPFISFHYVLCNRNYTRLAEMLELAARLGVGYVFVQPLNIYHEEGAQLALSRDQQREFQELLPELLKLGRKLRVDSNLPDLQQAEMIARSDRMDQVILEDLSNQAAPPHPLCAAACFEPWVGMVVRSDGKVGPCCVFEGGGDNVMVKDLAEIWRGEYFTGLRRAILSGNLPSYCAQCGLAMVMANKELREKLSQQLGPDSALPPAPPAAQSAYGFLARLKRRLRGRSTP